MCACWLGNPPAVWWSPDAFGSPCTSGEVFAMGGTRSRGEHPGNSPHRCWSAAKSSPAIRSPAQRRAGICPESDGAQRGFRWPPVVWFVVLTLFLEQMQFNHLSVNTRRFAFCLSQAYTSEEIYRAIILKPVHHFSWYSQKSHEQNVLWWFCRYIFEEYNSNDVETSDNWQENRATLCCLQNPCTFNSFLNFSGFPVDTDSVNSDFNQAAHGRKVRSEQMVDMKWTANYCTTVGNPARSAML